MAQFQITFGVTGGYAEMITEMIEADTLEQANRIAYNQACDMYDSYGVFENEYPDWDYDSDSDYVTVRSESIDSWCEYYAEPVSYRGSLENIHN